MRIKSALIALMLMATPIVASAHGNIKPQHGGIVQMTGETVMELVIKPTGVELYVSDDDEVVPNTSATAKLIITVGGKKKQAALVAGANNAFVGKGLKFAKGAVVGVVLEDKATGAKTFTNFPIK